MNRPRLVAFGIYVVLMSLLAAIACSVQDSKNVLKAKLEENQEGLAEIKVDSNITVFGAPRGVFTATEASICIDKLTPNDVFPLIMRLKDPNSPMPAGIPVEIHTTDSKIPVIAPTQQNQNNININVDH